MAAKQHDAFGHRLYSLYQRSPNGKRWHRVSDWCGRRSYAVQVFQNTLLAGVFNGWRELRIRPVKSESCEKIYALDKFNQYTHTHDDDEVLKQVVESYIRQQIDAG